MYTCIYIWYGIIATSPARHVRIRTHLLLEAIIVVIIMLDHNTHNNHNNNMFNVFVILLIIRIVEVCCMWGGGLTNAAFARRCAALSNTHAVQGVWFLRVDFNSSICHGKPLKATLDKWR